MHTRRPYNSERGLNLRIIRSVYRTQVGRCGECLRTRRSTRSRRTQYERPSHRHWVTSVRSTVAGRGLGLGPSQDGPPTCHSALSPFVVFSVPVCCDVGTTLRPSALIDSAAILYPLCRAGDSRASLSFRRLAVAGFVSFATPRGRLSLRRHVARFRPIGGSAAV